MKGEVVNIQCRLLFQHTVCHQSLLNTPIPSEYIINRPRFFFSYISKLFFPTEKNDQFVLLIGSFRYTFTFKTTLRGIIVNMLYINYGGMECN